MEKRDFIAPAGGVAILAGGLALAIFTSMNATALKATKAKTIKRYVAQAEKLLSEGKTKEAEKLAKRAIAVDPTNKEALGEFKKIALAGCASAPSTSTATTTKTTTTTKPAQPEAESDDEMGCI
jgi:thioredoxin-like negative regulator of GroEL